MKNETIKATYCISQVELKKIQDLIGEFMARVITEKAKSTKKFDTSYVQPNLKLNQ